MAKAEKGKEETKVMTPWRQFSEIARMERAEEPSERRLGRDREREEE
jgi:hypothetical protein